MGIHGLTTFLRENKRALSKTLHLSAEDEETTPLVVDGWSFIFKLVEDSNLPWVYGGNYPEFSRLVVKVVTAWLAVGFMPIIFVFDGSTPPIKFTTVIKRLTQSYVQHSLLFFRTSSASRNTPRFLHESWIIPPLAYTVCVNALLSFRGDASEGGETGLDIHFADEEGDPYAVELAGRVKGYITGRDSDFVVLNSEGYRGYLPLEELVWLASDNQGPAIGNDGGDGFQAVRSKKKVSSERITGMGIIPPDSRSFTLSVSLYTPASLARLLNLPVSLLPLLGALVGNDYTHQNFITSLASPSLPPPPSFKSSHTLLFERRLTLSQRILHASTTLGTFLHPPPGKRKQKAPQSVMELIQMTVTALLTSSHAPAALIGSGQATAIVESIVEGTLPYAMPPRPSEDETLSKTVCSLHAPSECRLVSLLDRSDNTGPARANEVASLYLHAYRLGKFSPWLMDILSTRSFWPRLFLENPDTEAVARSVSRHAREFAYALMEDGLGIPDADKEQDLEDEEASDEDFDDLDEVIDVMEEESDYDYGGDISDDVGKLRGALRDLQLEKAKGGGSPDLDEIEGSNAGESTVQSSSVRSPVPLPRPSYTRKPVNDKPKFITEYVRRGNHVVPEEIEVLPLRRFLPYTSHEDNAARDDHTPLQLRPETERLRALFDFLQIDPNTIRSLDKKDIMPLLSLRLVVKRMHERAIEGQSSKERQLERWTRREARTFMAAITHPECVDFADPPEEVSERAIQLTAQISTSLECVELLVQMLLLTDAIPGCAHRFSGLRFHCMLASSKDAEVNETVWRATVGGIDECFAEERKGKKAKRKVQKSVTTMPQLNGKGSKPAAGGMYNLLADMSM
ncbi:PIN domain-like protein [Phellopilus nigrolimitatus]|nr:PIN domain-like protein [Phellopilus nigrolimitatus]